ncbi:YfiH family protein [Cytobacillus eiseniae]|uniref:Purine nucleoside phosphorylase n=1 Tax=Cytobacillus eiseniae TaxID=762947 RepID=A0ABS4RBG5_9BACI|nr:peptidoglycan editing factor PgeF [Cytobacillus eiseniae]MBP2240049.1 YfiH family protein [Cytobacillus eiseniae]
MEPFILQQNGLFFIKEWMDRYPGLVAGFTSKNGGISQSHFSTMNLGLHVNDSIESVCHNRKETADLLNIPLSKWIGAEQTHEINIEKVFKKDGGKGAIHYDESFKQTDGFYTSEADLLLTLCFADCVPLYFFHEKSRLIGTVHAGWKGTVHGIAEEMVKRYKSEGIDENELQVIVGPSICKNCYIVDRHVISLVKARVGQDDSNRYEQIDDDQFKLDLKQTNNAILLNAGVREENIHVTNFCTSCHEDYFFSHRRDKGRTGRMMSFIGWKEDLQA